MADAQDLVTELFLPHRLALPEPVDDVALEFTVLRLGELSAGRLAYGRRVRMVTAESPVFHVDVPLSGSAMTRSGRAELTALRVGQSAVYPPGTPAEIIWSADCELLCLMVPRTRLEAELERLLGRELNQPLSFDFTADLGATPAGSQWRATLDLVLDELATPGTLTRFTEASRHLEGMVLAGLLLTHHHNHSADLERVTAGSAPGPATAAVREVVLLMRERLAEPWSTATLAGHAHVSPRSLQEGFRRDLDTSPMSYLRRLRLQHARAALVDGNTATTTVGAIATGVGFVHLGRFAALYRASYGESPSDTLRRSPAT